ncbi:hypothetical protein ACFGVS_03195 [Mucilaginibacter sp. AW1-7]|uniref:hypothetical protein n=1 Tax=Mucilaginibacter sp. AW1-7 TaxID=3349874 RepID=UPI003F740673
MASKKTDEKLPLINAHTHIFNGPCIPPYIGKTFVPWPLYQIFSVTLILKICKFWFTDDLKSPYKWRFRPWYKKVQKAFYDWRMGISRSWWLHYPAMVFNILIVYHGLVYILAGLRLLPKIIAWLSAHYAFYDGPSIFRMLVVAFMLLFIKMGRDLTFFILKKVWSVMRILPDKKTVEFIGRYVNIGRFSYYENQQKIFAKLQVQYPPGTGFIILPMDMEFMQAGQVAPTMYADQMAELAKIKQGKENIFYPFVAVDPRRNKVGKQDFFEWSNAGKGNVVLDACFIKDYIEKEKFSGFKIYPAIGYYPFDHQLLALWKYAADENLPITTHCIRGTIFYRGKKEKSWDTHPVFQEAMADKTYRPMLLKQMDNVDFINNFTHPLNYLILVEERLLRLVVATANDKIQTLFGYNGPDNPMDYDLKHLKLCFAHYGGDDEWKKYFESDRDFVTKDIITIPAKGINFFKDGPISESFGTLENIWKGTDWYSIITSMMLQYDHLYADISYIIHNDSIVPLLKATLKNKNLKSRVLFGTDFYVVRNHKSEKQMLADIQAVLTDDELDAIARDNPRSFLNITTSVAIVAESVI